MLSLVHLIYMAGDKCMRQNACYLLFLEIMKYIDLFECLSQYAISSYKIGRYWIDLVCLSTYNFINNYLCFLY